MKEDWLKNKLNDRFDNFDSGLDLDQAWSDLDAKRNPPKKKRRLLFFWFGTGVVGMMLVGLFLMNQKKLVNSERLILGSSVEDSVISEKEEEFQKNDNINLPRAKNKAEDNLKEESTKVKERRNALTNNKKLILAEIDDQRPVGQDRSFEALSKSTLETVYTHTENHPVTGQNATSENEHLRSMEGDLSVTEFDSNVVLKEEGEPNKKESVVPLQSLSLLETLGNEANLFNSKLPRISIPLPRIDKQTKVKNKAATVDSKKPKLRDYYNGFGVSVAYGIHQRNLTMNFDVEHEFVEKRQNQERPLDVIEANAFYRRYFNSGIMAELGFGFQQTNFKFNFEETMIVSEEVEDGVTAIHSYPDGTEETIYGTVLETTTTLREYTYYQKYQQVNLRGMVGKSMRINQRLNFGVFTGLEYGVYSNARGVSFSASRDGAPLGSLADLGYRNVGTLNALMRLDVVTELGPRTQLAFSIFGKSMLNDMITEHAQDFQGQWYGDKRNYLMGQFSIVRVF